MVKLPIEFVAIRFEGYYLNIINMCLYSLKRTGALRELKYYHPNPWRRRAGYTVSVNGCQKTVSSDYLNTVKEAHLKLPKDTEISVTHVYTT